ncbi:VOC family protein [Pseudogracilibacillus sp. SO30301A]|uniref:VOC family protein n=1 Tax=Pseudogracilibacillus sp. SO30301A TaxID=3098291 RepID=UPI00300E28C8
MSILFRVELYVDDIEKSLDFYENIIGLELYGRNDRCGRFNYDCFSLLLTAKTTLEDKHYFLTKAKTEQKGNGFELIIVVDKLEDVYERCQKNHIIPEVDIETYPWAMRGFKIADPDGYFLRITSK